MSQSLPGYDLGKLTGSHINQLGQFENIVEHAGKKGIVSTPPKDEAETYDLESQRVRIQTIASRLWLLGYLPKKIPPRRIEKKLTDIREAVARFQADANLKQDNWVGDKTWYAMEELVSFESSFTYDQWFLNDEIRADVLNAMHRAIQLRLWSVGLYKNKPTKNFKILQASALNNFRSILRVFKVKEQPSQIGFNFETLTILFDQDRLVNVISATSSSSMKSFLLDLPQANKQLKKELAQKFIVNCAKIELWLLGHEVKIDGRNDFQMSVGSELQVAMTRYYEQFEGKSRVEARNLAKTITPAFFKGISEASKISVNSNRDDASEEIAKAVKTQDEINKAWAYVKTKGMRLWDGLKRIWRWIKKIGRKVISFIKENIFKGFFRFASKAYKIIKTGISAVVKSIGVYLGGKMYSEGVQYRFSKDMDTTSVLSDNLSSEEGNQASDLIGKQSKTFNVACRIVSWIFKVFKGIVSGVFGWAKFLFSLVKGFKELKKLYLDFKALAT